VCVLTHNNLYNRDDDDGDGDGGLVEVLILCLLQSVVAGNAGEFRQNGKKKSVSVVTG